MAELVRVALLLTGLSVPASAPMAAEAVAELAAADVRMPLMAAVQPPVARAVHSPLVRPGVQDEAPPAPAADAWLGSDKFRHIGMSYAVTAFAFAAGRAVAGEADTALLVAVPVAAAVGIGKEVYDQRAGGVFSARDLVADALGIAAAWFLLREVR